MNVNVNVANYNAVDSKQISREAAPANKKNNQEVSENQKFDKLVNNALDAKDQGTENNKASDLKRSETQSTAPPEKTEAQKNEGNLGDNKVTELSINNGQAPLKDTENKLEKSLCANNSQTSNAISKPNNMTEEDIKKKVMDDLLLLLEGLLSGQTGFTQNDIKDDTALVQSIQGTASIDKLDSTNNNVPDEDIKKKAMDNLLLLFEGLQKGLMNSTQNDIKDDTTLVQGIQGTASIDKLSSGSTNKEDALKTLFNNLISLLGNVNTKLQASGSKDSESGTSADAELKLKQIVTEVVSGIDLTKLINVANDKSVINKIGLLEKNLNPEINNKDNVDTILQGNVNGIKINPEESLNNFKNKLVETLIMLSNAGVGIENKSQDPNLQLENFKRIIKQLDNSLNKDGIIKNPNLKDDNNTVIKKIPEIAEAAKSTINNSNLAKEDKLLKNMIGEEDGNDNKVNKLNTYIANLNSSNDDISSVKLPTVETPVVSKNNMTQDIVKVVKYMNLNDLKELIVKINPKELGEIVIKLTMEAGNMKANIAASNKDTYNLLTSNLGNLNTALGNSELKIQNVNINVYQDDTTFFNESFNQRNKQDGNKKGSTGNNAEDTLALEDIESNFKTIENNISVLI